MGHNGAGCISTLFLEDSEYLAWGGGVSTGVDDDRSVRLELCHGRCANAAFFNFRQRPGAADLADNTRFDARVVDAIVDF